MNFANKVFVKESPREDFYEVGHSFLLSTFSAGAQKVNDMYEFFSKALESMNLSDEELALATQEEQAKYKKIVNMMKLHCESYQLMKDEVAKFYDLLIEKLTVVHEKYNFDS